VGWTPGRRVLAGAAAGLALIVAVSVAAGAKLPARQPANRGAAIELTSPSRRHYRIDQRVALVFSCRDPNGVTWCGAAVDGRRVGRNDQLPTARAGVHTLRVRAFDTLGYGQQLTWRYRVGHRHAGAPRISIATPLEGAT
jgi:hypothetical protein